MTTAIERRVDKVEKATKASKPYKVVYDYGVQMICDGQPIGSAGVAALSKKYNVITVKYVGQMR